MKLTDRVSTSTGKSRRAGLIDCFGEVRAALLLAEGAEHWSGTVVALFQPAQETGDGARGMVQDRLADVIPTPDVELPAGT